MVRATIHQTDNKVNLQALEVKLETDNKVKLEIGHLDLKVAQ